MILKAINIGSADSVYKMAEDNPEDTDDTLNPPQCTTYLDSAVDEPMLSKSSSHVADKCTVTQRCFHACSDTPWLPLVVLTIANALLGNIYYAFPFFYIEFVESFNVTHATAGWAGSIQLCVSFVTGKKCRHV